VAERVLALAVIVIVRLVPVTTVLTLNVAVVPPAGIVTVAGTPPKLGRLEVRSTVRPPVGA
jgi:hypothetical protein